MVNLDSVGTAPFSSKGKEANPMRFSDYFGIEASQAELDFVDIPLETDIRLFVDPYAFSIEPDYWFAECNNLIVSYFQFVVDSIRNGDARAARGLLYNLHEPNDTHFGFSRGRPSGRGIGNVQAEQIHNRLRDSEAVQTGMLRDLSDCELVIPGVGPDKISDITINVIRSKLVEYTLTQCHLFGIQTRRVVAGAFWDPNTMRWNNRYADLPIWRERRIILVPKAAARYRMAVDHMDYYHNFVLEFHKAEHFEAGSSLVKVLKNGKRVIYKKDLKQLYPPRKDFLFRFSYEHPQVLEEYKQSLPDKTAYLQDEQIERLQEPSRPIDVQVLVGELKAIPRGNEAASTYHHFIKRALEAIFYPKLFKPVVEQEIHEGRKRIDIVFNNTTAGGFFSELNSLHHILCPYVLFECKNYSSDPGNPELDQLAGRLSPSRGMFGMLICRNVTDKDRMLKRCRDVVRDGHGYVLVLDDEDIKTLIKLKAQDNPAAIDDYLDDLFRKLVF